MLDFKDVEKQARKVWKKNEKEIEKSVQDNNKKLFSFLEGPPTANAPPALHHLEVRTFKDIICKFRFMQGFSVPRKGGWDCHGLPVEVQVEKKLGLNSKKEILRYGQNKFIKKCKNSVFSNILEWKRSTEELGYWIDLKNPYATLDNDYVESVWWSLKELYKKNLLYEDYKVVPFCPRCGTPLSSHEVAQGYKDIKEESVYIAFKLKNPGEYILAWTTTPWTLPGNVALAVGKNIDYVKVKLPDGDKLILGKDRLNILNKYKVIDTFKGKKLVGLKYEPLFDIKKLQNKNSHKVILADFVTTEEGTGVVHTAGMYGEDDYNACKKNDIPLVHTVEQDGKFNELVPRWEGKFVKDVEKEIIEDLGRRKLLLKTEKTIHTYPFCWRCDSPLLYYAIKSWFIKVSKVKNKLVKLNKKINWSPKHIKEGRFGLWLEGIKDWTLSRFKFWGTPLPIWRCECGKEKVIGSVEELRREASKKFKKYDLHRPWIDEIKIKCKCGKAMERIPDVIDCWYDSGAASFAQFHYPFENKNEFKKRFPYDFIAEAIDQTRGWFYTLHAIATMLFGEPAYKNVICAGHIVDEKGEKMSKSKGNVIQPREAIDKAGVDAVRLQFCTSAPGNQKKFSIEMVKEAVLPFLTVLYNCKQFYEQAGDKKNKKKIEDKWIISKLNSLIKKVTQDLEKYDLDQGFLSIMDFVVNNFSRSYIKIVRDREDSKEILGEVLRKVSLLLAPYAPYISEYIYKDFEKQSVHLSSWPKVEGKKINKKLEKEFEKVLEIIEAGLAARSKKNIGLKWPLIKAIISIEKKIGKELHEIIKKQLNVKSLKIEKGKLSVKLDIKLTPELEIEGFAREITRKVQAARKKAGLVKTDKINLIVVTDLSLKKQEKFIKERTNAAGLDFLRNIKNTDEKKHKNRMEVRIKQKNVKILFTKL
jgi:isoleucyl-tRNA synthetase